MYQTFVLVCIQLFLFTVVPVLSQCPSGWSRYQNSCYHLSRDVASWADAMKMCEIHGSYLAAVENDAEDQYLKTLLNAQRHISSFWLAGSDWENENEWVWEPFGVRMNFTNWHHGQPDNGGNREHCLSVHRAYRYEFSDDQCHNPQHYVCEKHDTPTLTTETSELLGK